MRTDQNTRSSNNLSAAQTRTFQQFRNRLAKQLPDFRVAWVQPVKDNMIELQLESDKLTYRSTMKAAKLAVEVEDETGVIIILR